MMCSRPTLFSSWPLELAQGGLEPSCTVSVYTETEFIIGLAHDRVVYFMGASTRTKTTIYLRVRVRRSTVQACTPGAGDG